MRDLALTLDRILKLIPSEQAELRLRIERIAQANKDEPADFWWSATAQILTDELAKFDWVDLVWRTFNPDLFGEPNE